ncbi:MAG: glycosyltransferase [Rhodanobacteraceae bacterium]|nr:glycosyltransferase [Rhodanobacteraceae bacterium]MBP6077910.1 glycosyltransferase [Xanthomonadales bacterium]
MSRPLTVVQLLPALEAGGVERGTLEIARALVADGHRSVVISAGGRLVEPLVAGCSEHIELDIGRKSIASLWLVPKLRRRFVELGADIVHARSRLPAWLTLLAWRGMDRATRPRFVTTMHGLNSVNLYSSVMARGERVICVSQTVREHILKHYPKTDPARLRVIPRAVDPVEFPHGHRPDGDWRKRFVAEHPGLSGPAPWLCLAGRGTRMKGQGHAIRLVADLRESGVETRLILLGVREPGREHYVDELRSQAQRQGVADAVVMTSPRRDVRDVMAASALVLQLSPKPEAFGRTVVEALNLGVPVLGFDLAGVGEQLRDLFPQGAVVVGDRNALAQRARALISGGERPAAFDRYRLQQMQAATLAVYRELQEAPRR